jgi:hypothetical protein
MVIEEVAPNTLQFAEYNPREITEHDFEALKSSIKEFGFVEPVVANKSNRQIIGGHMRVRAALELGLEKVPVVWVELDEVRAKILNLSLNRISGRWDIGKLEQVVYDLTQVPDVDLKLTGFEDWELKLYNPGEEVPLRDLEEIQGEDPNAAYVLTLTFSDPEKYEEVSKLATDGKIVKTADGEKLWQLLRK